METFVLEEALGEALSDIWFFKWIFLCSIRDRKMYNKIKPSTAINIMNHNSSELHAFAS